MLSMDNISREINELVRRESAKRWKQGYITGLYASIVPNTAYYSVVMYRTPANKIQAIKVVREHLGLGLKDAKELVETADGTIYITSNRRVASQFTAALKNIGANAYCDRQD